jgi:hypothetical protein
MPRHWMLKWVTCKIHSINVIRNRWFSAITFNLNTAPRSKQFSNKVKFNHCPMTQTIYYIKVHLITALWHGQLCTHKVHLITALWSRQFSKKVHFIIARWHRQFSIHKVHLIAAVFWGLLCKQEYLAQMLRHLQTPYHVDSQKFLVI